MKKGSCCNRKPHRRILVPLISITILTNAQCKAIIPTTTTLSSTILSRQKSLSIFHSTDNVPTPTTEVVDVVSLSQQGRDDTSSTRPTEKDVDDTDDMNVEDEDEDNAQLVVVKQGTPPLVSMVTTTTTSLVVDDIQATQPEKERNSDALVLSSLPVKHPPKQQHLTSSKSSAIFLCSLAMISGFGEICSLKSYGCFINMVTGSTVRILLGIAEGQYDTVFVSVCVITGYLSGIMLARIIKKNIELNHTTQIKQGGMDDDKPILRQPQRHMATRIGQLFWIKRNLTQFIKSISQKRNPLSELLWSVTPLILILFTFPELLNIATRRIWDMGIVAYIPLPFKILLQATGYGLIAQVISDTSTIPTTVYVLTGHYVTLSKSFIDELLNKQQNSDVLPSTTSKPDRISIRSFVHTPQQRQSFQIVSSFVIGACVALLMYQYCTFLLPVQHSVTGILFIITFLWYSLRLNNISGPTN
jgi:Protein of unknown function (DUF1275)